MKIKNKCLKGFCKDEWPFEIKWIRKTSNKWGWLSIQRDNESIVSIINLLLQLFDYFPFIKNTMKKNTCSTTNFFLWLSKGT